MDSTKKTLIVLAASLAYYVILAQPDIVWQFLDVDSGIFVWSAMQKPIFGLTHASGYPVVNFVHWGLALGTDSSQEVAHRIALFGAVCSAGTATLLYVNTKKFIAPLIFMASGLVTSQSIIQDVYAPTTFVVMLMWHFKSSNWFLVFSGLAMGTHHFAALAFLPIWLSRRRLLKDLAFVPFGMALYVPLLWAPRPELLGWTDAKPLSYFTGQSVMLGGLSPEDDGLQRLMDTFKLVTGIGLAVLPLGYFMFKYRKQEILLFWLIVLPLAYYMTSLYPQAITYTMPSFVFGAVLISKYWERVPYKHLVTVSAVVMLVTNFMAIQTTDTSAARDFINQVEELPDGSVVYAEMGWQALAGQNARNVVNGDVRISPEPLILREQGLQPTHRTVVVDTRRYFSVIRPCSDWDECMGRYTGDEQLVHTDDN